MVRNSLLRGTIRAVCPHDPPTLSAPGPRPAFLDPVQVAFEHESEQFHITVLEHLRVSIQHVVAVVAVRDFVWNQ